MDNIDFVDGKTSFIFLGQQLHGCCFQNIIFILYFTRRMDTPYLYVALLVVTS